MTYPMAPFQLHHPGSVAEALELAGAHPGAPFLAGGTDLVVNLRKRLAEPEHVISLRGLSELEGVSEAGGWLAIGARTTIAALAAHPLKSVKRGVGEYDRVLDFAGVSFIPGHYLYADANGLLVSPTDLFSGS